MYLVLNPGWIEEDRKASLAFRGMEEELRIFNRTQRMVAWYGYILSFSALKPLYSVAETGIITSE